jgi:UDP-N-acetylmuramate--alanine ligase
MMQLADISKIYFIGIGGIGMSALARYFNHRGATVSGYDRTPTVLTGQLEAEGIRICYEDDISLLDEQAQLVVYTPAIPSSHLQFQWYLQHQYPIVKRSDVLGIISEGSFNICIAGTHGKTSISTMVAHLLRHTGYGCNAFLGGVSANYGTNFWASEKNVSVIEADEYDRSFLKLHPDISVISSMDPDHLDIYGTAEEMEQAYIGFATQTRQDGSLLHAVNLAPLQQVTDIRKLTYAPLISKNNVDNTPDFSACNIRNEDNGYRFDVQFRDELLEDFVLKTGGLHNVENMTVAIAIAKLLSIPDKAIIESVASYRGVKRRFEYIVTKQNGAIYIDDYAHHPRELEALLKSVRNLFPGRKITVLFQPHLFTRTRDFAKGFAESLQIADQVLLMPIYPARELPIEGVTSSLIGEKIEGVEMITKEDVAGWVRENEIDVFVTAGAGDIDTLVPVIKNIIEQRNGMSQ